jgi:hypothetical protein
MLGIVEGGVPERHDAVAHIFIDGPLLLGDDLGHRRQEGVHEACRCSGIHAFGAGGETTDVAKHDGHLPRLATEDELLRVSGELLDIVR